MKLSRKQLLNGEYVYPTDLIYLRHTHHLTKRLYERCTGLDCIPKLVRITKNNIYSAMSKDGVKLNSVVVRLKYGNYQHIFLAFCPWDGALKSLWFKDRKYARS